VDALAAEDGRRVWAPLVAVRWVSACGLDIMNRRSGASVLGWVLVRDEFELVEVWSAGGLQSLWDLVSDHRVDHRARALPQSRAASGSSTRTAVARLNHHP
jgi:hypothetical protein